MAEFLTSLQYWNDRYNEGGNSGAGSAGRLAAFKSAVLNSFVRENNIGSVIEFGAGDGTQLALADYPKYIGIDVSGAAVHICRQLFTDDRSKSFFTYNEVDKSLSAELSLSIDVIFHLVEDDAFDSYMRALFSSAIKFVVIYSSDEDRVWPDPHVRHRNFSRWINEHCTDWGCFRKIVNPYPYDPMNPNSTSFCDFYMYKRRT